MFQRILPSISILLLLQITAKAQPPYTPPPAAPSQITGIEWYIDHDPGFGNATPLPHTNAADITSLVATIPLASITHGIHQLFIRSKDASGAWSMTAAGTFENLQPAYTPNAAAPAPITNLEVFFNHDPGFGKGIQQTITGGTDIANLTLTLGIDTLPKGPHRLFIRTSGSLTATAGFANDVPLPLTWLYARGEIIDGQSHLSWATAEEQNTKSFEIEHSRNGHAYTTIGATPAAGNSTQPLEYTWIHTTPATGANYYRIKQVDLDKKFTYSRIIPLLYNPSLIQTTATPNPFTTNLTIVLATPADRSTLIIYNTAGIPLSKTQLPDGARQQTLDLTILPAGIYFLRLQSGTYQETLRVLKRSQ